MNRLAPRCFMIACLALLAVVLGNHDAVSSENQSSATGKLVDWHGQPVGGVKIVASYQGDDPHAQKQVKTVTSSDGTFTLSGLFPSSIATLTNSVYIIQPMSDKWETQAGAKITAAPAGETLVIKESIKIKAAYSKDNAHLGERVADLATGVSRFSRSDDGVVTDSETNLQWLLGPDKQVNYNQAEQWVAWAAANVAGGGWQMPTREQLKTLYDPAYRYSGHISPVFNVTHDRWVWAEPCNSSSAWYFYFDTGNDICRPRNYSIDNLRVFAVRPLK